MTRTNDVGLCEHCNHHFHYYPVHNGFGDTAYSYCESCGTTALLSGWFEHIPKNACLRVHGPISRAIESLLKPCECRGAFKSESAPRCPKCKNILQLRRLGLGSKRTRQALRGVGAGKTPGRESTASSSKIGWSMITGYKYQPNQQWHRTGPRSCHTHCPLWGVR